MSGQRKCSAVGLLTPRGLTSASSAIENSIGKYSGHGQVAVTKPPAITGNLYVATQTQWRVTRPYELFARRPVTVSGTRPTGCMSQAPWDLDPVHVIDCCGASQRPRSKQQPRPPECRFRRTLPSPSPFPIRCTRSSCPLFLLAAQTTSEYVVPLSDGNGTKPAGDPSQLILNGDARSKIVSESTQTSLHRCSDDASQIRKPLVGVARTN